MIKPTSPESAVSYSGSIVSIGSALTLTDLGIIFGIITALLTCGTNFYFQRRRDRREERELQARLADRGAGS